MDVQCGRLSVNALRLLQLKAVFGILLTVGACSDYSPIPRAGTTFEAEARRISENLGKPVPLGQSATVYAQVAPGRGGGPGGAQPIILGQPGAENLLRGVSDTPIGVDLNFNNAPIPEVARTVLGEVLKKPFVIDTSMAGSMSLRVDRSVSQRVLLDTLRQSIERSGGEIQLVGMTYQISSARPARPDEQRVAQLRAANNSVSVVPLTNARASMVVDILKSMYPTASQIVADPSGNILMIGGPASERAQIAATAESLDIGGVSNQTVAIYRLNHSNSTELADQLRRMFRGDPSVEFMPMPRNNTLMVVARQRSTLSRISQVVQNLDQGRGGEGRRLFVIPMQHARALAVADTLRQVLGLPAIATMPAGAPAPGASINPLSGQANSMSILPSASSPAPVIVPGQAQQQQSVGAPGASAEYGAAPWSLDGATLRVVASNERNSLLVFATPDEFAVVQDAVRRLDIAPLQVLIEATIMDVELNDALKFGVQGFLQSLTSAGNLAQVGITATPLGFAAMAPTSSAFNFVLSSNGQVQAAVNALRSVTNVTVLSAPQVVVQDNQQAKLEVGQQVPIQTGNVTQAVVSNPSILNSVSYVQTGVILTVTPRVNAAGGVDMDIRQEVSEVPEDALRRLTPNLTPTLNRRVIDTRVSVQSSQTVALGGLISELSQSSRERVPLLGDIPVVGWLFGQTDVGRRKRELLVFLTPTAFSNPEEARGFTLEMRRRMEALWQNNQVSNRRNP